MLQRAWIWSVLVLVLGIVVLRQPIQLAGAQNDLALCWVQSDEPAQACKKQQGRLIDLATVSREARLAAVRYLGLAEQYLVVDNLIGDMQPNQLPPLEARFLFTSSVNLGNTDKAVMVANRAGIPAKQLLELAIASYDREDFLAARKWVDVVASQDNLMTMNWTMRRNLGLLIWQLDQDGPRSLRYLNQVNKEEPNAVIPLLFLALIHLDDNPEYAVELFDQAIHVNPDAMVILKDILANSGRLETSEGRAYSLDLRRRIVEMMSLYLGKHPLAERVRDTLHNIEP